MLNIKCDIEVRVLLEVDIKEGEYALIQFDTGDTLYNLRAIYDKRRHQILGSPVFNSRIDTELFIKWIREALHEKDMEHKKKD